jgi:GNAT superfamily N-acetyltransferase
MLQSVTLVTPPPSDLGQWAGPLGICYCEVFSGPPWNEAEQAAGRFVERLRIKSSASGFRIVLAIDGKGRLVGFAYGATTFGGVEPEPWYNAVTDALGAGVTDAALLGAFELVELGVVPGARDRGTGGRLHDTLLAGASERRAWLMTRADASEARGFYANRGWLELGTLALPGRARPELLMTRRLRE